MLPVKGDNFHPSEPSSALKSRGMAVLSAQVPIEATGPPAISLISPRGPGAIEDFQVDR